MHSIPKLSASSKGSLQAAATFAEECSSSYGLDCKAFIDPLVLWATTHSMTAVEDGIALLQRAWRHVSIDYAEELADQIARLAAASSHAGYGGRWPEPSTVLLLAFYKEVRSGPKASVSNRYTRAARLMTKMAPPQVHVNPCCEALCLKVLQVLLAGVELLYATPINSLSTQICSAAELVALDASPVEFAAKPLGEGIPRKLRLQALEDAIGLLLARSDAADAATTDRLSKLQAAAYGFQRVLSATESAGLSSAEQDAVEAALRGQEPDQSAECDALQRLLFLGSPLSKIEITAASLAATQLDGAYDSDTARDLVAKALERSVSAVIDSNHEERSSAYLLDAVAKSLEDSRSSHADQLRQAVWTHLQDYVLNNPAGSSSTAIVHLLSSLTSSDEQPRYTEWCNSPAGLVLC